MVFLFAATVAVSGAWLPPGAGNSLTASGHKSQPSLPTPSQSRHYRGQPGYNIVSPSSVHVPARSGGKQPLFRGGVHSPAPTTASTATPARGPLIASGPTTYNNLNKQGMPADGLEVPPDSTGAIGPNNYVEMDNSSIAVYDRNLNTVASTTIDNFAGAGAGTPFCDPQVQWDNTANRWLLSALYCNIASSTQAVLFAWSATSDPSNLVGCAPSHSGCTGWCEFAFGNTPYLLDFQKLGHSAGYLVIGGNLYDETIPSATPPFVSAGIEWTPLPTNNSDTSCTPPPFASDSGLGLKNGDGSTPSFTPVPVNQTSNNSDVWIVSAYDPAGNVGPVGPQSKLATWDLDGGGVLHQRADINVNSYQTPTPAAQLGSSDTIDTLDGRLTQAAGNASAGIWTQHTVLDSSGRSEVDWYELVQSGLNLTLFQQGNIDTANAWTFNAAVSPRWDGVGTAIFYNVSSTTQDPSIVAQTRRNATPLGSFDAGRTALVSSSAADTETLSCNNPGLGVPCRWGDYSGATPDPIHQTIVWGTSEFNTAGSPAPAWSDENFAVHVANTPATMAAPVGRSDGRGDVALTWTPPQFEPDACPTFTVSALVGGIFATSKTVTGLSSGTQFRGLTAGTTYTFTVLALNCGVPANAASPPSNPVTIDNAITSDPGASPQPRPGVTPEPSASPQPR